MLLKSKDPVVQTDGDPPNDTPPRIETDSPGVGIPNEADFIFSYASPRRQACFRDRDHGSWYISDLCEVLCRCSTYLHLDDMLKEVHRNVAERRVSERVISKCEEVGHVQQKKDDKEYCQVPEVKQLLRHNIYF